MQFAVGYQFPDGENTADLVRDYRDQIAEVYFPWVGLPSARVVLHKGRAGADPEAQEILEEDLRAIRGMGIKLDLLFNANCYGAQAVSRSLENRVRAVMERLNEQVGGADIVTTVSPFVARTVKKFFPSIEVRASVNLRLGTIQALGYSRKWFDSYYIQRDVQRNIIYVRKLKEWADRNGKTLCMLANSGCLRYCPAQTFHDNLVAHDTEISRADNVADWNPHLCWSLYQDRKNWPAVLQGSWVRPEDLHHYEGLVKVVKLATRMHTHPRLVVHAYANRQYAGNLLDLFEPGFGPAFAPYLIHNARFPENWFEKTSTCHEADCDACGYCRSVLEKTLMRFE
ncbi:MAG: hypothetical protein ABIH24_01480 [Verrucomicrobiota bacterium]